MIIATAGHVDHGKTSLVRNLTGVETDRLKEEQRRGLSIDLGYAYWRPDSETTIGFIDVPGHRRFINNMISGISGIDLGLLVVAADDGVMPQTREHIQVMQLLGVENYLLVASKCDRVDERRVADVLEEAAALLPARTPAFRISNTTSAGIEALREELRRRANEWSARAAMGHFRMSVDRAFNLPGLGLILTGTIASGSVETGSRLLLRPQETELRVRSIHTQDRPATAGRAGERCALNVSGDVHRDDIERGDWVVAGGSIEATSRFDARVRLLTSAAFPLKHLAEVKLHIGAKHCRAKLLLIGGEGAGGSRLRAGETAYAQIVTERPVHCCRGDRFLLRDHGETATLGGGMVLAPLGPQFRKAAPERIAFLGAMEHDGIEDAIRAVLAGGKYALNYDALLKSWNIDAGTRPGDELPGVARVSTIDGELWLAGLHWSDIQDRVLQSLLDFHEKHQDRPGIGPSQLSQRSLSRDDQVLFQPAIAALISAGAVRLEDGMLSASDFSASASGEDDTDWLAVAKSLRERGRQVPSIGQLRSDCGLDSESFERCLQRALRERRLVRINRDRYAESSVLKEFADGVLHLTQDNSALAVAALRDHLGCGRNVLIDVLEYFDSIGFTRRMGSTRVVLNRKLPDKLYGAH